MSPAELLKLKEARSTALAASVLQQAILAGDEAASFVAINACMTFDAGRFERYATPDDAELRRLTLEIVDSALRGLLLREDTRTDHWRQLLLPTRHGILGYTAWMSLGRWLRMCGSELPDTNEESLDPTSLGELPFGQQARALGRYCVINDAGRELDVAAVHDVLDPRLRAFFVDWVLSVYAISPTGLPTADVQERQERACREIEARIGREELPASSFAISTPYDRPYRVGDNLRSCASKVSGQLSRQLIERLRRVMPPERYPSEVQGGLAAAAGSGSLVIASNWRDKHVVYRCMAPLLEGLRESGAQVCMPQSISSPVRGSYAEPWRQQSFEVLHGLETPQMLQNASLCNAIAEAGIDFAFFPEVTPANSSAWLATQRLARIQATGYGYPVTTGSPNMDYFIGGSEIEQPDAQEHYTEQLILLPGLGVSTLEPPLPSAGRTRPVADDELRLVTCATHRKLKRPLLGAWQGILSDWPSAKLDLFPAMQPRELELHVPAMAEAFGPVDVDLHPVVERQVILDTLVEADLYLDSFPFGGFNSLVEVLASGCPVVTLEGNQARNRFGAALLRRLGLPEFLIARSLDEYVEAARRVLADAGLRADLRARLADRDAVLAKLADPDIGEHFEAARLWMLQQGPRTQRPGPPILIRAGERPLALSA